jgi:hypothetical protein
VLAATEVREMQKIFPFSLTLVVLAATAVLAGSCQTYDFEPVVPLAISQKTTSKKVAAIVLKPNLFLVVDKSQSMELRVSCPSGTCPTRMDELKSAMATFTTNYPTVARMGLTVFPAPRGGDTCRAADLTDIIIPIEGGNDDATLRAKATAVRDAVNGLRPAGGTPTSLTLKALSTYEPLLDADRANFILLLTDGLPNCNDQNPNTCASAACKCTQPPCENYTCVLGCLDLNPAVANIADLLAKNVKTIVVGFGADTTSTLARDVLKEMAEAGGFPRPCPNGDECGAEDTCDTATKTCNRPYYQAANGAELAATLAAIGEEVGDASCEQVLAEKPSQPEFLSVIFNDVPTQPGPDTWSYDPVTGKVTFQGALCDQLEASTSTRPVNIEYRIVQAL